MVRQFHFNGDVFSKKILLFDMRVDAYLYIDSVVKYNVTVTSLEGKA